MWRRTFLLVNSININHRGCWTCTIWLFHWDTLTGIDHWFLQLDEKDHFFLQFVLGIFLLCLSLFCSVCVWLGGQSSKLAGLFLIFLLPNSVKPICPILCQVPLHSLPSENAQASKYYPSCWQEIKLLVKFLTIMRWLNILINSTSCNDSWDQRSHKDILQTLFLELQLLGWGWGFR